MTAPVAYRPREPLHTPVAQSDAIRRNQTQSDAIGRNQTQSDAIGAIACGAISGNQDAIRGHQDAISDHQDAIRGHQDALSGPPDAIRGHQRACAARRSSSETQSEAIRTQSEVISAPVPPAGPPRRRAVSRDGEGNGRCTGSRAGKTRPTRPGFRRARARATLRRPARTGRSRVIMTQSERSQNALRTQSLRTQDAIRAHSVRTQDAIRTQSAYLQARDARERVDGVVGEK